MKIYYGNGEVRLEGAIDVAAFEIFFKGRFIIDSKLPDSWVMDNNNKVIIGISLGNTQPELLFNYEGDLKITSCKITNRDLSQELALIITQGLGFWNKLNTKWEDFTEFPNNVNTTYVNGSIPLKTFVKEKIKAEDVKVLSNKNINKGSY